MITRFVETTDKLLYGKFLVCRLDPQELVTRSAMPEAGAWGDTVLNHAGRRRFHDHSTLVIDLQRGTGFVWPLSDGVMRMRQYMDEHYKGIENLVCPMYLPFVAWLHEQGTWAMGAGKLDDIPRYLEFERPALHELLSLLAR